MAITKKIGFYRKHDRKLAQYTGELLNHKTGEYFIPPSRTKQSFVAECDINNILKQYKTSGLLRHVNAKAQAGMYTDLPAAIDYQESLNTVLEAEKAFASLPSSIRSRFKNDPTDFLEFVSDPANQDEIIKMGLATDNRPPPPPPAPPPAEPPKPPETPPKA